MFGFSFGELIVVAAIALLVLGPNELKEIIRSWRKLSSQIEKYYKAYMNYFNEAFKDLDDLEAEEDKEIVNYILDMEGNLQKTYDLSKIMPDLKRNDDD